jgi:hypothetical protein
LRVQQQVATPPPGTEAARSQNQQQRIGQGIQSGQLTGREAGNLENREASIHNEKQNMRAADNGHLTRSDRRTLNRRQNRSSAAIARDKQQRPRSLILWVYPLPSAFILRFWGAEMRWRYGSLIEIMGFRPCISEYDQTAQNTVTAQFFALKEALMRDRAVQKHESAWSSAKGAIPSRISSHATCLLPGDSTNP